MNAVKPRKNFTEGPVFFKLILFTLPIMATGILQIMYNMADNIVVGQFSGDPHALAAVGCTSSLSSLLVNLFMGIAAGSGVVVAQCYGAKQYDRLSRTVHTAVAFSIISGIVLCIVGLIISKPALILMGTDDIILDKATLYIRIIFLGIPASSIYNFGASILRSVGDSKTPLIILSTTGLINVLFNLVFVILFNMSIAGVALATIIAQYLSAIAVTFILVKRSEPYSLNIKKIKIDKGLLLLILRLGIPAGIQSALFSVSNIVITSAINELPLTSVSAKTIVGNIDALLYTTLNSYFHASMTYSGQNFGAQKYDRIIKGSFYAVLQVTAIGILLSQALVLFSDPLINLFINADDPNKQEVLMHAKDLLAFMLNMYVLCGIMETLAGILRGLGYSLTPMIVALISVCGIRIFWCTVMFHIEGFHNLKGLFTCYPVSWIVCSCLHLATLVLAFIKIKKSHPDVFDFLKKKKSAEEKSAQ